MGDMVFQIADKVARLFLGQTVTWTGTVAAVPEQGLLAVAQEGRRAGDSQRSARPPVGPVFGRTRCGLYVETQVTACLAHHSNHRSGTGIFPGFDGSLI